MAALGAVILRTDSNDTNDTQIHASDEHHQGSTVLFLFLAFAVGGMCNSIYAVNSHTRTHT